MKKVFLFSIIAVLIFPALVIATTKIDLKLVNRFKGQILLQVQQRGEAWYLNPNDGKRYYMKDGATAYEMMRKFGKGMADTDLEKIPVGNLEDVSTSLKTTDKTQDASSNNNSNSQGEVTYEKGIGDKVEFAILNLTVNSVSESSSITGSLGTQFANPGAKFAIVNVTVTNNTNAVINFPYDGFLLVDNKQRQYPTYGNSIGYINNYLIGRSMSPSINENGVLIYELPNDATSYSFLIGKGGTNIYYKIVLK